MRILIALILVLLTAPLHAQSSGVVRGRVRAEGSGEPLAAAMVEVVDAGRSQGAATGSDGRYFLPGVPAGRRVIRARHVGYAPLEVEVLVPAGREVELDIALRLEPVRLQELRVQAGGARSGMDTVSTPAADLGLAGARVIGVTPGLSELGLTDAARGVPGQEPVDPSDVLFVRGAAADLKLVYLDGAPVYAPFPLGGLLDAFSPDLLRAADVYLGGAPARYDGGLSYILDLRTRGVRADAVHSTGAVDLLSSRALVEVPLGEHAGVLAAGRAVHGLGTVDPLPYGYGEGMLRADVRLGERGAISLTGFRNAEEVWTDDARAEADAIRWGNSALSLRYRGSLGGGDAELTLAVGDFNARLPLEGAEPVLAEGDSRRTRVAADFARDVGGTQLRYGASFDRQSQSYRAHWTDVEYARRSTRTDSEGDVVGAYADVAWQAVPRLRLRGGLRADRYSLGSELVLAPRAAATWLVTERAALTLAAGRYHQYLRTPEKAMLLQPAVLAAGEQPLAPLSVGHASHLALSLDQDLGESLRLGLEGFFKSYEGIPGGGSSRANASGMDVWVRRSQGDWTGWLGYSLAWVWSPPDGVGASQFSGRHLLSSGLSAPLGERTRLDLQFAYGEGLPYSAIPLASNERGVVFTSTDAGTADDLERRSEGTEAPPLLPEPDRPYLRLDVAASRTWLPRWGSARLEIASYLKLLNTLGRRDALFYRYERDRDATPRALGALPIVPVVGLEWRF